MKPKILLIIVLLFTQMLVSAQDSTTPEDSLRIVTTTTQATDLIRILSDGAVGISITPLMGAGVDPHLYQPTEADIVAMNEAQLIVYSGLHLEGQFDEVFKALSEQGTIIYALSQAVKDAGYVIGNFNASTNQAGADDPHFWFDPRNWELTTDDLALLMSDIDPVNAEVYRANADAYIEELQALFDWGVAGMQSIPEEQRNLVTSHDAFQYFGAAFGWQVAAIQGISTRDEAGVGDVQGIVDFVIDNQIPVLFVESSIPPDTIEAVIAAVADAGGEVRLGVRELYSDAMGVADDFGGTYIGMIAENIYTILQSYECAGIDVTIPDWINFDLDLPTDLTDVSCDD